MFFVKKLVGAFLLPLQTSLLALVLGVWLITRTRWRRTGWVVLIGGVVWLAATSNKGVGIALARTLESRYAAQPAWTPGEKPPAELAQCQAIVVLGGGHADAAALSVNNRLSASSLSRIVEGARIARDLPETPVWVTGPRAGGGLPTHASVLRDAAVQLGVGRGRIHENDIGVDTQSEAVALASALGGGRIALVTSARHMPRASALFRKAGFDVIPCPADFTARLNDDFRLGDYLAWDLTGLDRSTGAIYEYLGLAWAKLRRQI